MPISNLILRWRRVPRLGPLDQPPHPSLIVDVPSGYPEDLELYGSPDTVNIEDILSVDVTPLSFISISSMDATPYVHMAKSVSVPLCRPGYINVTDPQGRSPETQTGNSSNVEFIIDIVSSHSVHNSP